MATITQGMAMKIGIFDPYQGKFTRDMTDYWRAQGHEIRRDTYYDPDIVDWADLVWFDTVDNNYKAASNPHEALISDWDRERKKDIPWGLSEMDLSKKKIILRPIDIEVWQGAHAACDFQFVNDCIFIAPHIRDMMMLDSRPASSPMRIHTIPHSINPDRWTFKERKPGFNIAVVAEIWESKGIDYVLQIAMKLKQIDKRYNITYLGREQDYHWHRYYREEFIKNNELPITFIDWVEDVDEFLEGKNYLLHCSTKEAFSAAVAEAAAKGIRPIVHAFGGYEPLWGDSGWVWQGIDEAIDQITDGQYNSKSYRDYLYQKGYVTDIMMSRIMEIINA